MIDNTRKVTLHDFIEDHVEEGSIAYTDDFKSHENLEGYEHGSVSTVSGSTSMTESISTGWSPSGRC